VAAYSTLQPLVASALAAAFLGEQFGWEEGIGFALIAAGLWQVSGKKGKGPKGQQGHQGQEVPRP
jgi:drug/metabolite transporter (DMT)-like permease